VASPAFHISTILRPSVLAFGAVFVALLAITSLVRDNDAGRYLERRYADVGKILSAAIDPRFQSKADEITRVAERLVVIGAIRGGVLYDGSGHEQQVFGERIEATFDAVMRTGRTVFRPAGGAKADFYYPPEVSLTPFHIFLRVDVGEITSLETIRDDRAITIALGGGVAAAATTELIMLMMVWWPLRRVRTAVDAMLHDPAKADRGQPLRAWGGEVGKVTFAVECLRSLLADVWRTRVMVADTIIESSPFAVLQINVDGHPFFANAACSRLFGRDILRTHEVSPLMFRDIASGARQGLKAYVETHKSGVRTVEYPTPNGPKQAMIASLVLGAETRAPVNVLVGLDVSALHGARLSAEAALKTGMEEVARATTRTFEYRQMLEACLALMGGGKKAQDHLQISGFAREWLDMAAEAGAIQASEIDGEDPEVAGGSDNLRAVVRFSAFVAYTRLGTLPADMRIDVRGIDFETVGLQVQARAAGGAKGVACVADPNLALAALKASIARVDGQLAEVATDEQGAAVVRVILRGAAERMQTGMASKSAG
jgi:PAS domain-containing protein